MADPSDGRGILYPTKLPSFHREAPPDELSDLIRWFWLPRWDLAPGRVSRQKLLPFPASNLVVEADCVTLYGPTTRGSHRDLRGSGWAVGALLRPAGVASLHPEPSLIRDAEMPIDAIDLHRAVRDAMSEDSAAARAHTAETFAAWLSERLTPVDDGLLANTMEDLITSDRSIVRVAQVAEHLYLSVRAVQRIAERYVGLPPLAIIRRYRLQEAAERLRVDASLTIAQIAADLGYTDHAHLTRDFGRVLGVAPTVYRQRSAVRPTTVPPHSRT